MFITRVRIHFLRIYLDPDPHQNEMGPALLFYLVFCEEGSCKPTNEERRFRTEVEERRTLLRSSRRTGKKSCPLLKGLYRRDFKCSSAFE